MTFAVSRSLLVLVALLVFATPAQAGELRHIGGQTWSVTGSLAGVVPPAGETVEELYVERPVGSLEPLTAFGDLRMLHLAYARGVDITPLASLAALEHLTLLNLRDVVVPPSLPLAASLESLVLVQDGWKETGAPAEAVIRALDWPRLTRLQWLSLQVGGLEPLPPIAVDLGFLRVLPALRTVRIDCGVHHRGAAPSPLAPPFDGLPRGLREIRIDAWRPGKVRAALQRRYPRASVVVQQRTRYVPGTGSWTISRFEDEWITYGSFADAFDNRHDTEYEALAAARRTLRRADPALLKRLDFDPESAGTGISAPTRRDLVRALELLGIR